MATKFDFVDCGDGNLNSLEQGATFNHKITWNKTLLGVVTPVDLTGYSAKMQVRADVGLVPIILELSTANGRIVLGGVNGSITMIASALVTSALTPGLFKYDLELIAPDGTVTRLIEGFFEIKGQVTV